MRKPWKWIATALLALSGCNAPEPEMTQQKITVDWSGLTGQKIIFAHQSVGANILSGTQELARRDRIDLPMHEQRSAPAAPGITHFTIGRNEDPLSKIRDFAAAIDAGAATGANVALMKLCYIDFKAGTDVRQVADAYIGTLDALAKRHPDTMFVAVTAPLTTVQTGPRAWLKKLLGRQPGQYAENGKRGEFNRLIREHYGSGKRLFDLARIEAEAGGTRTMARSTEGGIETLDPTLTDDGGHLNARGQLLVAGAFLNKIAELSSR
jgi:hypothetical protein